MARAILLALLVLAYPFSDRLAGHAWTYMFAHANLFHLALNAITLWSFGKPVERQAGPWPTLALFMVAAVVGGAAQSIVTPDVPLMGASAGIFGLVGKFVADNPDRRIGLPLLMFRGWQVLLGLAVASIVCLIFGWLPQLAHVAHFIGMLVGALWASKR